MKTVNNQFKSIIDKNLIKSTTKCHEVVHNKVRNVVSFRVSAVFDPHPDKLDTLRRNLIISARSNFSSNIKYNV